MYDDDRPAIAGTVRDRSPIDAALAEHTEALQCVREMLDELERRLVMVTNPDHGTVARPVDGNAAMPSQSPIMAVLTDATEQAQRITDRLRTILVALEI